jgi:PqqA peptide cyclase
VENGAAHQPLCLVAELTHRCPLGCPYCSNPLALEPRDDELDATTWARVFREAAALGIKSVQLSGGEPGARRDVVDIAAHAREAGLHGTLVTSGYGIAARTMRDLWEAGLDAVQVSFQDSDAVSADRIAGQRGAFQRKHAFAAETVRIGLPLTIDVVLHSANIEHIGAMVGLALGLKAQRIEFAHVQFRGWALKNGAVLMPSPDQLSRAATEIEDLRLKHRGRIIVDMSALEDHATITITPSGRVLPGPAVKSVTKPESWNVRQHSLADICADSPAFTASRLADFAAPDLPPVNLAPAPDAPAYTYRRM